MHKTLYKSGGKRIIISIQCNINFVTLLASIFAALCLKQRIRVDLKVLFKCIVVQLELLLYLDHADHKFKHDA